MNSKIIADVPPDDPAAQRDKADRIASVLRSHPGVREAAVVRAGGADCVGLVVADDTYLDDGMKRAESRELALKRWRKSFDLTHFTGNAKSNPVGFNIQGWNSSYTGGELPETDMREWVQLTVAKILGFAPKSVYEIGCGTGMLLLRVAPSCERYAAADFSPATLDRVRDQLKSAPALEKSVELLERMADDFSGLEPDSFDTVVLNSVVQFFPGISYLTRVLEGAIEIVRPGGRIFAGDIQSLPLRSLFLSSVELFRSSNDQTVKGVMDRIRRRISLEPWLFVSPAYFLRLASKQKKLSRIEIEPRPGYTDNEMTRYRYNAILHVGEPSEPRNDIPFADWREKPWGLEAIRELLEKQALPFGIKCIPNARVERDVVALDELKRGGDATTTGELKRKLKLSSASGIHPQVLVDLAKSIGGSEIRLSWAACRRDGSFDAAFFPAKSRESSASRAICWPQPEKEEYLTLTSSPGQSKLRSDFVDQISAFCKHSLPPELTPAEFKLVDTLPNLEDHASVERAIERLNAL